MTIPSASPLVSDEYRAELARQGQTIYDTELKALLEPSHNGEYIVLHVDTGDYALGRSFTDAKREMRRRYPRDGRLIGLKIGPEPQYSLAARLLTAEMASAGAAK